MLQSRGVSSRAEARAKAHVTGSPLRPTILAVSLSELIQARRPGILAIASRHGAGNVCLFGSVARGEDTPSSGIGLLIDITGPTSPWFPASLAAGLEPLLGRRVQIVVRRSLSPWIRGAVLHDAVQL